LPLPVGAVVKYRYSRQGAMRVDEHTSNRLPVRYRLYQVLNPGVVQDIVSAWSDSSFLGQTGRILGKVTDQANGEPIPGLLVEAGGSQSLTASDGSFLIEGLPPGTHNLVVYALDGRYETFQQGAFIAAESTTPASIRVAQTEMVAVVFTVSLPEGTLAGVPVRIAGNLLSLGNTFSDLSGGMSVLASRMPVMAQLPDGRYSLVIDLPVGGYFEYKYTLGDGFWNAEHAKNGGFAIRNLVVPEQGTSVEDLVDNWGAASEAGPILFSLTVPAETPETDHASIQFKTFGWTEPIPIWPLGNNRWSYLLYSPLSNGQTLFYRYCRNEQCGSADDARTPGSNPAGRSIEITALRQNLDDTVDSWKWWAGEESWSSSEAPQVAPRDSGFIQGIELGSYYHPSIIPQLQTALTEIGNLGADWTIFAPTWTYTRQTPVVIEPVTGQDPIWSENRELIEQAQLFGLNVALFPTPTFTKTAEDWWQGAPRDFAWWIGWFERYRNFILYHADLARASGAQSIILGGDWIQPALPGGILADGSPSGVPADAGARWRELIAEIREHFDGEVFWASEVTSSGVNLPQFVDAVDRLYLLWSIPLADSPDSDISNLASRAARFLESEIFPLELTLGKPVILALSYPSAAGSLIGCVVDQSQPEDAECIRYSLLDSSNPEIPGVQIDLAGQVLAYQAVMQAINDRPWIDGIVSRGYDPSAALQNYSISVRGKPSEDLLKFWFSQMKPGQTP
jgi:hypothetical protein